MQDVMSNKSDFSQNFALFIKNVKFGDHSKIRRLILDSCDVSATTYHKWLRGKTTPTKQKRGTINLIALNFGYPQVYFIEENSSTDD